MKRLIIITVALAAPLLLAIGSNPRYIEEIAWGGGYGSTGGWLEADGDILTDGTITTTGGTVATAVTSNTSYTVNIDENNDSTSETFAVETNASGTDLFTVTEAGNATVAGTLSSVGATTLATTSGSVTIGGNAVSAPRIILNGAAGSVRGYRFQSGGVLRWQFTADSSAESGANAGSAFTVSAYDDAGSFIDNAFSIARASGGTFTISRPISATAGATFGDTSTDVHTFTGRIQPRTVTDAGMTATAGSAREALVYNSSDSRWYASIAGGSPATDWGYFLRNTDATQVLSNNSGITLSLKDANSTAGVSTISAEGTSGASTTYGGAITFTAGGGVAIYQDPSPTNTTNNRVRSVLYGAGSSLATFGDNTTAAAEAHVELQRSSDSVPAVLEMESADGTASYLFAGNNRGLRVHTAAPTSNTDGYRISPVRVLDVDTTAADTTSTVEATLRTYTVPGGTLAATGDRIEYKAAMAQQSDGGESSTIYVKFGGTTILTVTPSVNTSSAVLIQATIIRTGATTASVIASSTSGANLGTSAQNTTVTATLANDQALLVSGVVSLTDGTDNKVSYAHSTVDVHYAS